MKLKITAAQVLSLLAIKHSKDVFVSECKDGPTMGASGIGRLDAWVMPRSWAHPETTGYEIKVHRGDFLRDDKWLKYLDLCSSFYFVAPKDVISRDEVPEQVGLLEVSKNAKRLLTKKKAPLRQVTAPEDLFRYVLMCRATISGRDLDAPRQSSADEWAEWVRDKTNNKSIGTTARMKIANAVIAQVGEVMERNNELKAINETYASIEQMLKEAEIEPGPRWTVLRKARTAFIGPKANEVTNVLERTIRDLEHHVEQLKEITCKA